MRHENESVDRPQSSPLPAAVHTSTPSFPAFQRVFSTSVRTVQLGNNEASNSGVGSVVGMGGVWLVRVAFGRRGCLVETREECAQFLGGERKRRSELSALQIRYLEELKCSRRALRDSNYCSLHSSLFTLLSEVLLRDPPTIQVFGAIFFPFSQLRIHKFIFS